MQIVCLVYHTSRAGWPDPSMIMTVVRDGFAVMLLALLMVIEGTDGQGKVDAVDCDPCVLH